MPASMRRLSCMLLVQCVLANDILSLISGGGAGECSSDMEGDESYKGCYGWCQATQATDHCKWCKCRGCSWCDGFGDGGGSTASNGCAAAAPGDTTYRDCQDFCSASAMEEHCPLCKCKACSFCSCESEHEDDSEQEHCEPWCSVDFHDDHCSRCKCKACGFCKLGLPCASDVEGDLDYETCEPFCHKSYASSHCGMCKCKGCGFCVARKENAVEATCNSGQKGDADEEMCEPFCSAAQKDTHCGLCKCRACDLCTCTSEHEGDSRVEECQKWCNGDLLESHCGWCACKGCGFCKKGGKACKSFYIQGDTDHEDCEDFCSADAGESHCGMCKCKRCPFCKERGPAKLPGAAAAPSGPACFSGKSHDTLFETCDPFCEQGSAAEHCKLCKCKGCKMCSGQCDSGIARDAHFPSCGSTCDPQKPEASCAFCRCRGCPHCNADGTPSGKLGAAAASDGKCTPFNEKDSDKAQCLGHCKEANKASHCETCKCKGCSFCEGFKACSSGVAHDSKWTLCEQSCNGGRANGGKACDLCKCKECPECQSQASQPCDSGILSDIAHEDCMLGLCAAEAAASHCQTCRCKACGFCKDALPLASPPPAAASHRCEPGAADDVSFATCESFCSPSHAKEHCGLCKCRSCPFCEQVAPRCRSNHLGDSGDAQCMRWCDKSSLPANLVCSFCQCKGCQRCHGEATPLAGHTVAPPGDACLIGAEFITTSAQLVDKSQWVYWNRVRLGGWIAGALVTLDFSGGPKLKLREDSFTNAELVKTTGAARVLTFKLADAQGPKESFGFAFSTDRGAKINLAQGPSISCSKVHALPPPQPSPPPPPYRPFVLPAAAAAATPAPSGRTGCALGGAFVLDSVWAGGTSFRARVVMALWRAGAVVSFDFTAGHTPGEMGELSASHAMGAENLGGGAGVLRFRLGERPEGNQFGVVGHGGRIHAHPRVTCTLYGEVAPSPPAAGAPLIRLSCEPLGAMYSVIQKWNGGFKAAVAIRKWQPGAKVWVRFSSPVQLLNAWSAVGSKPLTPVEPLAFVLGEAPDAEYHGFGFTARGDAKLAQAPTISCQADAEAAALIEVPKSACGMGAAYSLKPVGDGSSARRLRLRIHQWEAGAQVRIGFASAVEIVATTAARELEAQSGRTHTLELDSHPDPLHGISLQVRELATGEVKPESIACTPRPGAQKGAAEPALTKGSPEAPPGLQLVEASCNSIKVEWRAAVDNGFSVYNYVLYYRRQDAAEGDFRTFETPGTSYQLGGLSGGTTYFIKVRAQNARGQGKYSARLTAATDSAGAPKVALGVPVPRRSFNCTVVQLDLPMLRSGCRGDAFMTVQGRALGGGGRLGARWTEVVARTTGPSVAVEGLEPMVAYEFRAVAQNKDGRAPPGEAVGPLLTDSERPLSRAPPEVVASSSASFAVSWAEPAAACSPLRWRVEVSSGPQLGWLELTANASGGAFAAAPLRCISVGCSFRVSPVGLELRQGTAPPPASKPTLSLPLSPLPAGSVRVQLRLRSAQPQLDLLRLRVQMRDELAAALQLQEAEALQVVDLFGTGQFFVLDLRAAAQGSAKKEVRAALLAEQLHLLVESVARGALGEGEVSAELDAESGVQLLLADGRLTPVRVSGEARAAFERLPRHLPKGSRRAAGPIGPTVFGMSSEMSITVMVGVLFAGSACVYSCLQQQRMLMQFRHGQGYDYGKVRS